MADTVYYHLERMLPELDDLHQRGLFSPSEIKEIARRRREFEFRLERRSKLKDDYLHYVDYELQLEKLRKLRKKGLIRQLDQSKRRWQSSLCDRASAMRIMLIFERAVTRFKGDLELWLRYLDYCRSQGTRRMQKVLTKALRLHPTVPGLWIYAAAWEFEHNANVTSARVLMQRGLRMCPQSETLWLEYFRMELVYAERLKANMDATVPSANGREESEDEEHGGVASSITTEGEQMPANPPSTCEDQERVAAGDELGYKLARAIYRNAITAIPSSATFRQSFVEKLKNASFKQASTLEDEILKSLENDFSNDEGCWDWQARMQFERGVPDARDRAVEVYEKALRVLPSARMYELYAKFLEERLDSTGHKFEENVDLLEHSKGRREVETLLIQLYEGAQKSGVVSACLAEGHATVLLRWGKVDAARELLAGLCSADFKACARLWALRILLEMKREAIAESGRGFITDLCMQSLNQIPVAEARDLWYMILGYFASDTALHEGVVELLEHKSVSCGGGQTWSELACSLIDWSLYNQDIDQARKVYNRLLALPAHSVELYKHCIKIESRMVAMKCKDALQHMRKLFQAAVDMDGQDAGLWLEYCSQEMKAGNFELASAVYWRAKKTLDDPSSFIEGYQRLLP